jgi:hypothetical protein
MNSALNYWRLGPAEVTTAPNPLTGRRRFFSWLPRRDGDLHGSGLGVDACSNDESAQRELAGSNLQHVGLGAFPERRG